MENKKNNTANGQPYDLSEEGSKRGDGEATKIARGLENDDTGNVSPPEDDIAENSVATSLDEE